jgi:hypothetical protein
VLVSLALQLLLAVAALWVPTPSESAVKAGKDQPGEAEETERDVLVIDVFDAVPAARETAIAPLPAAQQSIVPPSAAGVPASAEGSGLPPDQKASGETPTTQAAGAGGSGSAAQGLLRVPGGARSVVYVIDRSGSMGQQGRLTLARRELTDSLQKLSETTRFQVIAFNRRPEALRIAGSIALAPATAENIQQAIADVQALIPEGGTEHFPALKQALVLHPEVIYFLTDADDLRPEDVRTLTQLNGGKTAIHTIELNLANREREDMPMHRLAHANRGRYLAVDAGK